jgi:hypothetical protein
VSAPAALSAQVQKVRPAAEAPYQTKLECAVFNMFMYSFLGEETDAALDAGERGQNWINLAIAEKNGNQAEAASDLETMTVKVMAEFEAALGVGDGAEVARLMNKYNRICDPFGG